MTALLTRIQNDRNALGLLFLLPTAVLLLLFLTYPLGLGTWLGFTDTKIGRRGEWIGLENFEFLWGDAVTRLALFNTLFYTIVASVIKFVLGLWLALLLNKHLPFKAFLRAIVLLPFIVPTALSAKHTGQLRLQASLISTIARQLCCSWSGQRPQSQGQPRSVRVALVTGRSPGFSHSFVLSQ